MTTPLGIHSGFGDAGDPSLHYEQPAENAVSTLAARESGEPASFLAYDQASRILGGATILGHAIGNALDAHEVIVGGMPNQALQHLVESLLVLDPKTSMEKGVGASLRTLQRGKNDPGGSLSSDIGGRTWKFAEILGRTTALLGDQAAAERWLDTPAIGLDGRKPLDLFASPVGVELVEDFLGRLEYGVYV